MVFTMDATLALAAIASEYQLSPEMINILYQAACEHRAVQRARAAAHLRGLSEAGHPHATAALDRLTATTEPTPVYAENVRQAHALLLLGVTDETE